VLLVAEVLDEEETILAVSGFLVKRGMIPHESVTLDGGEDGAVLWRFGCDLVLLGPFLLTWLGWGASALVWALLVFANLPVCYYNNQDIIRIDMKEC